MNTHVKSIKPLNAILGDNQYEVVVVGDSETEYTLTASVISSKGMTGMQISPDITIGRARN